MQTTEELKRAMYKAIAQCKIGTFVPPQIADLEEALEAYLERLRVEWVELDHKARMSSVLQDAYDRQCQLTRHACQVERETWALNHDLKHELGNARARIETLELASESASRLSSKCVDDFGEAILVIREKNERIRILEEANRAAGDSLREIVSERDSLLEANPKQPQGAIARLIRRII